MPILSRLFQLQASQTFHFSIDECWRFFSDPRNLSTITPPSLRLDPISEVPDSMYAGMIVSYRVRPVMRIPLLWVTEITRVEKPFLFVDEQRFGPYRFWHHQHRFHALAPNTVRIEDVIHYALPLSFLSGIVNERLVAKQLRGIFAYRADALKKRFRAEEDLQIEFR